MIGKHFEQWLQLSISKQEKRRAIATVLLRKDLKEKSKAYKKWQHEAYRDTLMIKLHNYIGLPHNIDIAKRCIKAWKKYTWYKKNRESIQCELCCLHDTMLVKRILREWLQASLHKLPARVMGKKLEVVFNRLQAQKALYLISE